MWTMEELLSVETLFLSMNDMTDNDWQILDFQLEKYDRTNEVYDLGECKVLAFILQQNHYNKANFLKVPTFIRKGRQFQELAVRYNPELTQILFPTRACTKEIRKKILPFYFEDVKAGKKNFEIRKDEDDIQVGDTLILCEWDGTHYTGRELSRKVKYVLRNVPQYGLQDGFCIIGL